MDERIEPQEGLAKQLYDRILEEEASNVRTQQWEDKDMAKRIAKYCMKVASIDIERNHS